MERLINIDSISDIPEKYQGTPVGLLLEYHNLGRSYEKYQKAALMVAMCMDNRKQLRMPDNFSFIIRTAGANLRYSEFMVSFAIAIGDVKAIAIIGHTQCGMVNVISRENEFVKGLVLNAGWDKELADQHFNQFAPVFEIGNEMDFVLSEVKRLRLRYPKVLIAPMLYRLEDNRLYLIKENTPFTK